MKRAAIVAGAILLSSCSPNYWRHEASAYRHYGDRLRVYTSPFFGQPCGAAFRPTASDRLPVDRCFLFGPQRLMHGRISSDSFEATFAKTSSGDMDDEPRTRAVSTRYRLTQPMPRDRDGHVTYRDTTKLYDVSFVGRTLKNRPARDWNDLVIIDRIESIRRVLAEKPKAVPPPGAAS